MPFSSSDSGNGRNVHWTHLLAKRFFVLWGLKMVGTMGGIGLFFVAYFWVLRHPASPVTVMPTTRLDDWIGFQAWTLPLYLSLWFYVALLPAFLKNLPDLLRFTVGAGILGILGLAIFYFWPTAVPPMSAERAEHAYYGFLNSVDASGNACPSLHVAFAVFTAFAFREVLHEVRADRWAHRANWMWATAIGYSAVATGQHVVLDAVAGAPLGGAVGWIFFAGPRAARAGRGA